MPSVTAGTNSAPASTTPTRRKIHDTRRTARTRLVPVRAQTAAARRGTAMTSPRPIRFGVQTPKAANRKEWVDLAIRCEANGYDVLSMPDHFGDQLAPVPALMTAADATTTLRVGALVFDNDYRHPVVLAKELATMDVLSAGRGEIGLGAGWMASCYAQSGIPLDRPGVRIDRFEEAIAVMRGVMADGPFSFAGRHYTVSG